MIENLPYADATIRADLAFHEAIFAAAQNAALQCLASAVTATIQWSLLLKSNDHDTFVQSLVDHEHILHGDRRSRRRSGRRADGRRW